MKDTEPGEQQDMDSALDSDMSRLEIDSNVDNIVTNLDIDWLARQLLELRVSSHGTRGMESWEMSGIEWLNNVALSTGGGPAPGLCENRWIEERACYF